MVVDTSALVAILRLEAEADLFLHAIVGVERRFVSAMSVLETTMVLCGARGTRAAFEPLDALLSVASFEVAAFDRDQASRARDAFLRFGKGRHAAALNFGDCASYALASSRNLPLLFKGDDFSKTDLAIVFPPRH